MLFRYNVWTESSDPREPIEITVFANTEGEAFRVVERRYPDWVSVELVHSMRVGAGR